MSTIRNALQAPPFPLRLRPFRPPPLLLRKADALCLPLGHSPLLLRGVTIRGRRRVSPAWVLVRSPLPRSRRLVGEEGGGPPLLWARAIQLLPPSRSSRVSLSRGRDSREERRCASSWSRGSLDQSHKSCCLSTDRSRSRGRRRSRRDSSRSPSARVRSRRSRSRSSDRYQDYRVRSRSSGRR